ncbi:sugar transporter [Fusarium flagelliforme]|uniref:Sugar transporter n=1 Tax=Fusarium flagelliforme TaxID=2675880 RepID=A0A395M653_9HYPO|nr:sugar transporter [Fusarium flagelliforme]
MGLKDYYKNIASIRQNFNRKLGLTVMLLCISQFNYGFDIAAFNNMQAMPAFNKQFGDFNPKTHRYELPTSYLSLFNSLQFIGYLIGIVGGSWISKKYGRRVCIITMSLLSLIWTTISITSKNRWQIMVGRTASYIFTGMDLSVIPVFQAEITPSANRGFTMGTYQFFIAIILAVFYIPPTIVLCCICFVPESPRWLAMNDRNKEALSNLTMLRTPNFNDDEIKAEYNGILASLEGEAQKEKADWKEMFKGTNLRRTFIVVGSNFFLTSTGTNFANTYGAVFIARMGTINPFTVSLSSSIAVAFLGLCTILVVDKAGRKYIPIASTGVQILALYIMAGLGTIHEPSRGVEPGIIVCMQLCIAAYSAGWAPIVHITSVEVTAPHLRDITYRCANIVLLIMQFTLTFALPYMLWEPGNLQSKVGFIFGSMAVLAHIFCWTAIPECKGLSLEVIDRLFKERVPYRKFQKVGKEYMAEQQSSVVTSDDKGEGCSVDCIHVEDGRKSYASRRDDDDGDTRIPAGEKGVMRVQ